MAKLFVDKSIEIHASPSRVWEALTKPENTDNWTIEFTQGTPFQIHSDWHFGSPVLWKDDKGEVLVEGKVTKVETNKYLRFTVANTKREKPVMTEEDGITYELFDKNGNTILHVRQGDFSVLPNGEDYFKVTEQVWNRILPKVKELAETNK